MTVCQRETQTHSAYSECSSVLIWQTVYRDLVAWRIYWSICTMWIEIFCPTLLCEQDKGKGKISIQKNIRVHVVLVSKAILCLRVLVFLSMFLFACYLLLSSVGFSIFSVRKCTAVGYNVSPDEVFLCQVFACELCYMASTDTTSRQKRGRLNLDCQEATA